MVCHTAAAEHTPSSNGVIPTPGCRLLHERGNNDRPFLYQRLYDYVLDEIRAGRLSMGDRVPSEMELAHLFGVSRITSKKALQTLNRDGVVERIIGKGSFVAAQLPALERLSSPEAALRPRRVGRSCIGFVLPVFSPAFEIGLLDGVEARTAELGAQPHRPPNPRSPGRGGAGHRLPDELRTR
jgi:DNA-binding transcriptional regulator YhcF (GntR family)